METFRTGASLYEAFSGCSCSKQSASATAPVSNMVGEPTGTQSGTYAEFFNVGTATPVYLAKGSGALIEREYNSPTDAYGIGQYDAGTMRVYTAGGFPKSSVSLSVKTGANAFDDVIRVERDPSVAGKYIVKMPMVSKLIIGDKTVTPNTL